MPDQAEPKQPVKFTPRSELVAAIEAGGSVLVRFPGGRGVHATRVDQLPSEADFASASGSQARVAEAKADLDADIARLQKQKADLEAAEKAKADLEAAPASDLADRAKAADEAKARSEAEAKKKADAEAKVRADAEKAKADAEVKAKADAEAKAALEAPRADPATDSPPLRSEAPKAEDKADTKAAGKGK